MVRVREVGPPLAAWQYPAPELANISAMPRWLTPLVSTGQDCIYVEQAAGTDRVEQGDWLVLLESGVVRHVRKDLFDIAYEVLP